MLPLINPVARAEAFDHPEWLFEPKFDGFRAVADTVRGRLTSRTGAWMPRFEAAVLDLLPRVMCSMASWLYLMRPAGLSSAS